jgi:DNA sulfur modification protein DndB
VIKLAEYEFKTYIPGIPSNQFGKKILATQIRFSTLEALFTVDEEVQRKLVPQRRFEIREFIIASLKENDFFFSPFIFSARGAIFETKEGWVIKPGSKLYILDGQHRASAMSSALSHLKSQKETCEELGDDREADIIQGYIDKLKDYPVAMQVYLELSQQEERQLFTDINTERKEAHTGLIMKYDQRDIYTEITRKVAAKLNHQFDIEKELSRLTNENSSITSLTIMRKCLLALFEGNLTVKKGDANFGEYSPEEVMSICLAFFESWLKFFPKQMANRRKYVSGLTGTQVALALTVFHLTKNNSLPHLEAIKQLVRLKRLCTWKHDDPIFSHLYDPTNRRIKNHSSTTSIQKTAWKFFELIHHERIGEHDNK